MNQSIMFYLPKQKLDTLVNASTNMAGYQKPVELIKLITHCNNMIVHYTNLTYTHKRTT